MNLFYLHKEPEVSATLHCDIHVVKMIIEYAQMLSTAHRMVDGEQYYGLSKNGRRIARWRHPNSNLENVLYKASHINHPSAVWARESVENYQWLYRHLEALGSEYKQRYGRVHKTIQTHSQTLTEPPRGISRVGFTDPPQCMPDECKNSDTVVAYQTYYNHKADDWDKRGIPMKWYGQEAV